MELFVCEVLVRELGAAGAVVSEDEPELDPELPGTDDFPANASIGINKMKLNVDKKNNDL